MTAARLAAVLVVLSCAATGCAAGPTPESLKGPAKQVSSAVRATAIAVDLRSDGRTTAAVGSTVADDMLSEVESAVGEVEALNPGNDQEQSLRDDMLASFTAVSGAILHARDILSSPRDGPSPSASLSGVRSELSRAREQLDGLLRKTGTP